MQFLNPQYTGDTYINYSIPESPIHRGLCIGDSGIESFIYVSPVYWGFRNCIINYSIPESPIHRGLHPNPLCIGDSGIE